MLTNNNIGKNAYEIRLEVIALAVGQADSSYYNELERRKHEAGGEGKYELPEDKRVREALRIAKKLYTFVEGDQAQSEE